MALCEDPDRIVPNWQIVDKVWNLYRCRRHLLK
jgi:hypothetical protein